MGTTKGSFAELAIAKADDLVPKPASLTFEEAGSLPISGITALRAIRDEGNVQPGQTVLVIGAAGGVGSLVVQIAKAYGAKVTAVCSTSKEELVSSIGADDVINYTREDFADGNQRCTNARKHSGGTLATVRVDYRPNVLEIEVIDVERVLRSRTAKGSRVDPRTSRLRLTARSCRQSASVLSSGRTSPSGTTRTARRCIAECQVIGNAISSSAIHGDSHSRLHPRYVGRRCRVSGVRSRVCGSRDCGRAKGVSGLAP
jgi:hypothetical protein